ncbi:MAG: type II toxin-antitoxin system RelE/ParE family toxin [Paenibacillaceae bacterium]|nr:type II toxin-antitoxin system RelE/ParE family toxin [Paenibacillaceae bacterium]
MDVKFYETAKGNSEVWDFIEALDLEASDGKQSAKELLGDIRYSMERMADGMPHSRPLRHGIFELRPGSCRITYFYWKGDVICLTVFPKTTNQTPNSEVARAVKRMKDWKRRNP